MDKFLKHSARLLGVTLFFPLLVSTTALAGPVELVNEFLQASQGDLQAKRALVVSESSLRNFRTTDIAFVVIDLLPETGTAPNWNLSALECVQSGDAFGGAQ